MKRWRRKKSNSKSLGSLLIGAAFQGVCSVSFQLINLFFVISLEATGKDRKYVSGNTASQWERPRKGTKALSYSGEVTSLMKGTCTTQAGRKSASGSLHT